MARYNLQTIPTLVDYTTTDIPKECQFSSESCKEQKIVFRKGHHYTLQEKACEDFETPISEYEFIHELDEFGGVEINGVIMKHIDGPEKQFHTLTRNDCESIGIPYEPRLEVFSKSLKWKKKRIVYNSFNPNVFSSTPLCETTGLIHRFIVAINGIKEYDDSGHLFIMENYVFSSKTISPIKLVAKRTLYTSDGHIIIHSGEDFCLSAQWLEIKGDKEGKKISFLISINIAPDGSHLGIDPKSVDGLSVSDIISVELDAKIAIPAREYVDMVRNNKFYIAQIDQAKERIRPNSDMYDITTPQGRVAYIKAMDEYYQLLHRMVYRKSHFSYEEQLKKDPIGFTIGQAKKEMLHSIDKYMSRGH